VCVLLVACQNFTRNDWTADWDCCSSDHRCAEGAGDCDNDSECRGNLVCHESSHCGSNTPPGFDCCSSTLFFEAKISLCRAGVKSTIYTLARLPTCIHRNLAMPTEMVTSVAIPVARVVSARAA